MRHVVRVIICAILTCLLSCDGGPDLAPLSVILFIGDGMGPNQERAGSYYLGRQLSFQAFPVHTILGTANAYGEITDSAAAATAMATGKKVANGVLSLAIPGNGQALETILERASAASWGTGLVTTAYLTHATPAAFAAHEANRTYYEAIAYEYLAHSRPDLLLGGGGNGLFVDKARGAGYAVADTLASLRASTPADLPLAGLFGDGFLPYEQDGGPHTLGYPNLADMTSEALRLLDSLNTGFFLMVESGLIDQAAHTNDAARMVGEVAALDAAVSAALSWAAGRHDVLIVVTADHETGGIAAVTDNGAATVPDITWTTTGHTGACVNLYAYGSGAEALASLSDNTGLHAALEAVVP